jgi:hypothetical protein
MYLPTGCQQTALSVFAPEFRNDAQAEIACMRHGLHGKMRYFDAAHPICMQDLAACDLGGAARAAAATEATVATAGRTSVRRA